jgi:hypothetical protein
MNNRHRLFFGIAAIAIIIKLSLFAFAAIHATQGKLLPDSYGYLKLADALSSTGAFATQNENGTLTYETFRTPGYPAFLAIFHGLMKIPLDGIILIQIAMTLLTAFIVYKTALMIEPRIAFLSAVIILFDPPITIFSLTILTESLFLLLIVMFMFEFTLYLKTTSSSNSDRAHFSVPHRHLILSAIALAIAAYARPVGYYLGFVIPFFILYANGRENFWKSLKHALIFIVIVYSIIGLWQVRNYIRFHNISFCGSDGYNLSSVGLFKSYVRSTDPYTKGMAPLPYYINVSFRSLLSVMTKPGHFKYFQSEPLRIGGYIFSYSFMAFWLMGFVWGIVSMRRNIYLHFILFVALYFITASVVGQMWVMGDKLRVPMMPFIAIISAYGWMLLFDIKTYLFNLKR